MAIRETRRSHTFTLIRFQRLPKDALEVRLVIVPGSRKMVL